MDHVCFRNDEEKLSRNLIFVFVVIHVHGEEIRKRKSSSMFTTVLILECRKL